MISWNASTSNIPDCFVDIQFQSFFYWNDDNIRDLIIPQLFTSPMLCPHISTYIFPSTIEYFNPHKYYPTPPKTNSNSIQLLKLQFSLHRAKVRRWFLDLYQILSPDHAGAAWRVCACSGVCAFQRLSILIVIETSKDTHVNERRGGGGEPLNVSDVADCRMMRSAQSRRWKGDAIQLRLCCHRERVTNGAVFALSPGPIVFKHLFFFRSSPLRNPAQLAVCVCVCVCLVRV